MKNETKQEVLDRLLDELSFQLDEYHLTLEADRIFEIRKDIRQRIKEIRKQISEFATTNPEFAVKLPDRMDSSF